MLQHLDAEADELVVVLEPTRNAWVPLAGWFRRRGARVVLVPPERSDCDGRPVSTEEGRSIVAERYTVPAEVRRQRLGPRAGASKRTDRRGQESQSAPAPVRPPATLQPLAGD